ncbi:MAG TPA: hypothetical protein VJT73_05450 [Polyangiaceae bacterium]|nr:hypothetical protein [Polyangiaceae bacterium]
MRKEYDLTGGRPNPYAKRLGASGRKTIIDRFLESERLVKLDEEVADAFPSNEAVNDALRLVLKLRDIAPRPPRKTTPQPAPRRRKPSQSR